MEKITSKEELKEYEVYKNMLTITKISTCQTVRLEYYTNYKYNYVYRYKMNQLEEVVKYLIDSKGE